MTTTSGNKLLTIFSIALVLLFSNCKREDSIQEISIQWKYALLDSDEKPGPDSEDKFKDFPPDKLNAVPAVVGLTKGYIWIKSEFTINKDNSIKLYGIETGRLSWTEDTYLNGVLIGSTMSMDIEPWNYWNYTRNYSISENILVGGKNTILIKLFVDSEGIIPDKIFLGEYNTLSIKILKEMFLRSYINGIVSCIFIIISLYHFLIYFKRKKDVENFYYGLFSLSYAFYTLNFVSDIIHYLLPFISYLLFQKFIFLTLNIVIYSLFRFLIVFVKLEPYRWFRIVSKYFLLIPALIYLFAPDYASMYKYRFIGSILTLPYLLSVIIVPLYGLYKKKPEAKVIMLSICILFAAAVNDMINVVFKIPDAPYLISLSLPLFIASIMFLLGNKFVDVHNQTDELNENLEKKVEERTKEVIEKMQVIQALNIQQDGDYYLTSLIEKPLSTNFNKSKRITTEIYEEQKKKFSFKNKKSELGGDICITGNLRFDNVQDRYVFFFNGDAMGKSMQGAGGAIVAGSIVNNILGRSARNNRVLKISPEEWMAETYFELDSVFRTFDGSMLISAAVGLINGKTGEMWYFNAEHPWSVLYRDEKAEFLENDFSLRKLGTQIDSVNFHVKKFMLHPGDILFCGSDGRDDINIAPHDSPVREINEDENLFVRNVESSRGNLKLLIDIIKEAGELTDDLSLIRIQFLESTDSEDDTGSQQDELIKEKGF